MSSTDFEGLINGPLAPALAGVEDARKAAMKKRWITFGIAAVIALLLAFVVPRGVFGWILAIVALVGGWIWGSRALDQAGRNLKDPALNAIAGARGLTYTATGFTADGYEGLHPLFGRPEIRTFSDRLTGDEGGPYALYEAILVQQTGMNRNSNRNRQEVFRGLIYSMKRNAVQGETVIVPDKGLFNFFKPSGGMDRVKFEDDGEFEKRFEVYSTNPDQARALVNPVVREKLKGWRQAYGKVFVRLVGDEVTVALGKRNNHFEVGNMSKSIAPRERVQGIWNDVDATVAIARDIRSSLG